LHEEGEILDFDFQEVGVSKEIIARSNTVLLAADASKFERKAPATIASLAAVDVFVTDREPPASSKAVCDRAGTRIVVSGKQIN
ncbi:MAG: DeoR family transcriptional regulator, partial [Pseudomonadota bacterium]